MTQDNSILSEVKRRSAWSMFMAGLTAAVGVLLLIYPFATATLTTVFLGGALIVAGLAGFILALNSQTAGSFFTRILLAVIYGLTGLVLLVFPFQGMASLTLFVGAMLVVRGTYACVAGFRLRPLAGWGSLLADGVMSALAGGLVLVKWPSSTFWAVGTLVGASVLVTGLSRLELAAGIRGGAGRLTQRTA